MDGSYAAAAIAAAGASAAGTETCRGDRVTSFAGIDGMFLADVVGGRGLLHEVRQQRERLVARERVQVVFVVTLDDHWLVFQDQPLVTYCRCGGR